MEKTTITLDNMEKRACYGGHRLEVTYIMRHLKHNRVNTYRVTCEVIGLENADLHLSATDAEYLGDMEKESNDETLTPMGAIDLFENNFC